MRSMPEKNQSVPSKDWFIETQEEIIKEKLTMIKFLNKDIAFNLQLKEKIENLKTTWILEHCIKTNQEHIRVLGDSIQFNRELIDERRKKLTVRNNLKYRNEG